MKMFGGVWKGGRAKILDVRVRRALKIGDVKGERRKIWQ